MTTNNIQYTGHNIEVTPALREFTEKKMDRLTSYRDYITNVHITFNVSKLTQIAEAQVAVPGTTIHAKAEEDEMYKAIDTLIDKLSRQLNKYREKQTHHR